MMPRRRRTAGVTLLELLVSLAMMAALALILASSFGVIGRALARLDPAQAQMALLLDRATLRRWIEDMPSEAALQADGDSLTFQTLIDDGLFWPGTLATVTVAQDGDALVATAVTPDVGDHPGHSQRIILSTAASDVALGFLAPRDGGSPDWVPDWPVGPVLPDLLRITYAIDGRMAPPLIVVPARAARYSVMSLSSRAPPG
ncbi:MAG: type II secretion system GspH family protein [Alphaproteobacteria bacterium]|nr:type II secretion system GspH family protein [Alphaproteobacteria bacterium]